MGDSYGYIWLYGYLDIVLARSAIYTMYTWVATGLKFLLGYKINTVLITKSWSFRTFNRIIFLNEQKNNIKFRYLSWHYTVISERKFNTDSFEPVRSHAKPQLTLS